MVLYLISKEPISQKLGIFKIMDGGGRHLENRRKITISPQRILTKFGTMMHLAPPLDSVSQ